MCLIVTTFLSHVRVSNMLCQNRSILLQDVHYLGVYVSISSTSTNTTSEIDLQRHHFDKVSHVVSHMRSGWDC